MIAHVFKPRRKNAAGKSIPARHYSGRYRLDGDYAIKEVALRTPDKQVAEQKLREIIREKEQERAGIIAPKLQRTSAERPLLDHLEDFLADLQSLGRTTHYQYMLRRRLNRLFRECKWRFARDATVDGFIAWRGRQKNKKPKTLNEYLNSINALLNWMVRTGRLPENPLRRVQHADLRGKQQRRRAFTDDELRRLLNVAGDYRLVYLTAAYTGLRQGELRQLLWADVELDHARPHIRARAATTKNRKEAVIPLHPELVRELRAIIPQEGSDPEAAVFFIARSPSEKFNNDLKRAGIPQIDALGRKVDFHALRYTFATKLAREGVSQRMAQELMRHSDPKLTAMIYTDPTQLPTFESVENLPWIETQSATKLEKHPHIHPQKLGRNGHMQSHPVTDDSFSNEPQTLDGGTLSPVLSHPVTRVNLVPGEGVEPSRHCWHWILNPTCLPIPPSGLWKTMKKADLTVGGNRFFGFCVLLALPWGSEA